MAVQKVHQFFQMRIIPADAKPEGGYDFVQEQRPFFAVQTRDVEFPALGPDPFLSAAAGDDHPGFPVPERFQKGRKQRTLFAVHQGPDLGSLDAAHGLEIVPHDEKAVFPQFGGKVVHPVIQGRKGKIPAEQGLAHAVDHRFRIVDLVEGEPETSFAQPLRLGQPLNESFGKRGLADPAHAANKHGRTL